ncbi:MAG: hypothetical protein M1814_006680 [Vezdaea aestivalis]|nr:MAG: hypothetical protein M1814_006680 [Vezdaea aestivalis]
MPAAISYQQSSLFQISPDYLSHKYSNEAAATMSLAQHQKYLVDRENMNRLGRGLLPPPMGSETMHQHPSGQRSNPYMAVGAPTATHPGYAGFPTAGFVPSQSMNRSRRPPVAATVESQKPFLQPTQQEARKEEKPVGGVSAYLDYEISQMTEFVAEMAQRVYAYSSSSVSLADIDIHQSVLYSNGPVSPTFRKFVSQILSATRLPSSTILLALHYLSVRADMFSRIAPQKQVPDHVYRMLTTALLLGSKFLDDNTFQNRSWCEVTGIPVVELNKMEREWLQAIQWDLHVDIHDQFGLPAWMKSWNNWHAQRYQQPTKKLSMLSPIETDFQRLQIQPSTHVSPLQISGFGRDYQRSITPSEYASSYVSSTPVESGLLYPNWAITNSPPSAPETGPSTPEYAVHGSTSWYAAGIQQYSLDLARARQAGMFQTGAGGCAYPPTANAAPIYTSNIWSHQPTACRCEHCYKTTSLYGMHSAYGPQTVVG